VLTDLYVQAEHALRRRGAAVRPSYNRALSPMSTMRRSRLALAACIYPATPAEILHKLGFAGGTSRARFVPLAKELPRLTAEMAAALAADRFQKR